MKKSLMFLSILSVAFLVGCTNSKGGQSGGGDQGGGSDTPAVEDEVTVNFYLDYNQKPVGNIYKKVKVARGGLITDVPANPTTPLYPEFPVFKGWSYKELISSDEDLWDFSVDKVNTQFNSFDIFGIWVAEGE